MKTAVKRKFMTSKVWLRFFLVRIQAIVLPLQRLPNMDTRPT
ncbi:hypothetical protein RSSM_01452 [Rhodopirellula sallentina SM41]|uniref:Uncharacterized protein n=1 Tax=Rhodopirellula sallentina SM41 TaxID=1263870 RepID=M5UGY0_9BACT|nr:hypothetical protein RSSM_01452 [Rhodopirellula sallentina SM41]